MSEEKTIYLTTPVFYPNDKPHLGHAFTVTLADALKRYYSSLGYKCWLSVGTDEHGEKIFKSAEKEGIPIEEFLDRNVEKFRVLWEKLGINYDRFTRTTDPAHKNLVKHIFTQFEQTNQIYPDDWQGWYCSSCEEGYSFRSIGKVAQCKLGHPLNLKNEKSFFLRVRSFKSWLENEYKDRENWIYPENYKKEMLNNFIADLDDLSITRSTVEWGIKVPEFPNQTIYVWFDALISYLSSVNYRKTGSKVYQRFWESPNSKVIHIIGKEICRFHSIYWPVILKNLNVRSFDTLLVHGWLLLNEGKMSKSQKNVIDPDHILRALPREALRLYLLRLNFWMDNNVSENEIYGIYNSYLSNTLGNLISRFYGILSRKFDYELPEFPSLEEYFEIDQLDMQVTEFLENEYEELIMNHQIYALVEKIFGWFRLAGKLIEKNRAWELEKEDGLLKSLMCIIYRILCIGTWALSPILIDTWKDIFDSLNISHKKAELEYLKQRRLYSKKKLNPLVKPIFFPRIDRE